MTKKDPQISFTPEERQAFERFYQLRLAEAGGGANYEQDTEITQTLLRSVVEAGMTPDFYGSISYVRRGHPGQADPSGVKAMTQPVGTLRFPRRRDTILLPLLTAGLLGVGILLVLIVGGAWFFLRDTGSAASARG